MTSLDRFADIHSHRLPDDPAVAAVTITSVRPGTPLLDNRWYSVGIHPWDTADTTADTLRQLDIDAASPHVVAIGETGLDKLRGAPLDRQSDIFAHHALLAESLGKPLIIHAVGAWDRLMDMHRRLRPSVPWVVHGFRGKPELARRLTRMGIGLSLGERFNPGAAAVIPAHLLHTETDESPLPIAEIRAAVTKARDL